MLLIADLSRPNALVDALCEARITPESLRMVILSAGVKHDGESVLSLASLRDTMQVNFLSAAEFATWLCRPLTQDAIPEPVSGPSIVSPPAHGSSRTALVLVSSMGRWHGMHFACGYNASKAALSIWGESLDMELRQSGRERIHCHYRRAGNIRVGHDASNAAHPNSVRLAAVRCRAHSSRGARR